MDFLTYTTAILVVILLLALFAYVMRYLSQGGSYLPNGFLQRILPRKLRLNEQKERAGFKIVAVKVIDQRRRLVAVDFDQTRYILLLSPQQEQMLDKITINKEQYKKQPKTKKYQNDEQQETKYASTN